jgi:tetratricopeptide (TPR) repeat protein
MAEEVDDFQRMGVALSMLGKAHVFRRELAEGRASFDRALDLFRSKGWTWLVPWTETYLAELELVEGRVDLAGEMYEHAFALASQINDPCFKSKSDAGLGLVEAEHGNVDAAIKHLESARMWLVETPDHTWTMACTLDSLCKVAIANGIPEAQRWVTDLESLSGRTGMRELLVHAYMHRHALGEPGALKAASLLAQDVDNAHLHERVKVGSL